ncbi:MAG: formylglycine-generating enzyme family protein [Pirellulaceae bacterium]
MLARHFSIAILCTTVFATPMLAQDTADDAKPTNNIEQIDAVGHKTRSQNSIGMYLAEIPAGTFLMGASEFYVELTVDGDQLEDGRALTIYDRNGKKQIFRFQDSQADKSKQLLSAIRNRQRNTGLAINYDSKLPTSAEILADSLVKAIQGQQEITIGAQVEGNKINFQGVAAFVADEINAGDQRRMNIFEADSLAAKDEYPQHIVDLTTDFEVGVAEVTQAQFEAVMGYNPSIIKGAELPVNGVTWDEAKQFCDKLTELEADQETKRVYSLPSEAQWEYVCRASQQQRYFFGENINNLRQYAVFRNDVVVENDDEEAPAIDEPVDDNTDWTAASIASLRPNPWGIFDLYGNIAEWCNDNYNASYYQDNPPGQDPPGPANGDQKVVRGGSFIHSASSCRSSTRAAAPPSLKSQFIGFRVVCTKSL